MRGLLWIGLFDRAFLTATTGSGEWAVLLKGNPAAVRIHIP